MMRSGTGCSTHCDDSSSSNSCDNTEAVAEDIQADWNADAAALSNPTVAFAPYPKDAQVSVAESDAFRGCDYKTVGVSITDALTGGDVTEQKPHCDWEGFDDGKYKNARRTPAHLPFRNSYTTPRWRRALYDDL